MSVARFGGRQGDRGWHRFTATSLDDHTHTVPVTQVPNPFPGVNVITQTQGEMAGEMSGSYTGINVTRIHSETGPITGNIIATGLFTYLGKTGRIEWLANIIGTAGGLKADATISIAEGDFVGVTGGVHMEGSRVKHYRSSAGPTFRLKADVELRPLGNICGRSSGAHRGGEHHAASGPE